MKTKNAALGLISVAAFSLPSIGMAQSTMDSMTKAVTGPDSGWYVGGSVGQSSIDVDLQGASPTSKDDSDTSFRIFGGYMFNKNFGAELGYADLGSAKFTFPGETDEYSAKAWDISVVGVLPIGEKFNVYGKLGWYFPDVKLTDNLGGSAKDSGSDLTYTVGVQYNFNKNLGIRADWQRYQSMGKQFDSNGNGTGEADVDVMAIGVVYKFK